MDFEELGAAAYEIYNSTRMFPEARILFYLEGVTMLALGSSPNLLITSPRSKSDHGSNAEIRSLIANMECALNPFGWRQVSPRSSITRRSPVDQNLGAHTVALEHLSISIDPENFNTL